MIERPSAWRAASASCAGSRVSIDAVADRLENGAEVADRDALAQQQLQRALDLADRELVGDDLVHRRGVPLLQLVEELARLLTREQLVRVAANRLGQMRDDHRLAVDDRVPERLGLRLRALVDPHRGQSERGLDGRDARETLDRVAGVHRERVARQQAAARNLGAAHLQDVFVRLERTPRRGCAPAR